MQLFHTTLSYTTLSITHILFIQPFHSKRALDTCNHSMFFTALSSTSSLSLAFLIPVAHLFRAYVGLSGSLLIKILRPNPGMGQLDLHLQTGLTSSSRQFWRKHLQSITAVWHKESVLHAGVGPCWLQTCHCFTGPPKPKVMCCVVHRAAVFFAVEQLRGANRGSYSKLDGGGSTYAIAMMTGETRGLNFAALHEYDDKTLGVEVQYLAQVLGRDRFYTHTVSVGGKGAR